MEKNGQSTTNNGRASHLVGRLGNLIREHDDFFELISCKFLSESRYSTSVQAASARLLLSCSSTWTYPHVFEEPVIESIKGWVLLDDNNTRVSGGEVRHRKRDSASAKNEASDSEMLKTYATGLLAICLAGGNHLVEDVLTSGLSPKLMRFLRVRVLGETSSSQKDSIHFTEGKNVTGVRGREDGRGRVRQVSNVDVDDRSIDHQNIEPPDNLAEGADYYDEDHPDGEDRRSNFDKLEGKPKFGDLDENGREDSARRRANRSARSKGKVKINEGNTENDQILTSPGSASRLGLGHQRSFRDRNITRNPDVKRLPDGKKILGKLNSDSLVIEREENDDCFQECLIGSKDISDLVKKAVRAAEAEARSANGPPEAIKAAGDAAAELVKTAALEASNLSLVYKATNNEDSAVLAASKAASTVIDAANAIEVSRNPTDDNPESAIPTATETEITEDVEDYFILDSESLAQLREKYCIQCLELLGEYVEVLGPVLHEKGVDVCLSLLQRSSKSGESLKVARLLPDVMKLICALAAHRKFAALFVDRGGMQKLLAVPRVSQNFFGLSSCLFTIGSLQGIMERVCALPSDVIHQIVELAIQLIDCPQDQARKNAALFFAASFVFRAIIDAFDAQDGQKKLLGHLSDAASVRSGGNSGTSGLSNPASLRNDRPAAEVLTSSEKQIAYHTCVALRQYFRAHLLLFVESSRPNKSHRGGARNTPAAYKPLDISNEAMDAVYLQLQKDRKLGANIVRNKWVAVDKFLHYNGHITMLELCQAPPVERYLHDLLQYALGVLHIVSLVPNSRKQIVNATLSNNRVGIAVILDAANVATNYVDPEIIKPALDVLVNLVCPPPSISNKPPPLLQSQPSVSGMPGQEQRNGESSGVAANLQSTNGLSTPVSTAASGLVGDRRISLAGCAGIAAQIEQGYSQAREAVRANNGIKVLLHLLQPRIYSPPAALDCLRALACRVLLGLARDDTIAHILTKLQVGKKLSELIRDSGSQTQGNEQQGRWQAELSQVAIELIAIVTNSGRASTLAATDAATPTLRRIERAAIAAATPINYDSRELLLLIHEHLQASGLASTAANLLKEAQLAPLSSLSAPSSLPHQATTQETPSVQLQWPSGRTPRGFLSEKPKRFSKVDDSNFKFDLSVSAKKKQMMFSPSFGSYSKNLQDSQQSSRKFISGSKPSIDLANIVEDPNVDTEQQCKTPIILPMKRKLSELKETGMSNSGKRLNVGDHCFKSPSCPTPNSSRRNFPPIEPGFSTPTPNLHGRQTPGSFTDILDDSQYTNSHVGPASDIPVANSERLTLDGLVVQYLKHQHRQCPAPITTLPPLSLLQPHVCPEPKRCLDAPSNITARLGTREFKSTYGGSLGNRRDRQFVFSRFRPWRTCRDDAGALLTCISFLDESSHIAVGSHSGEIKIFDSNSNNVLETCVSHQNPVTLVQSYLSGESTQLVLSSSSQDVRLWDASTVSNGPTHAFDCKAARFSNSGNIFAALSSESARREILIYDIQTCQLELTLSDTTTASTGRGHNYSLIHFSPSDSMLLWNGVLWDRRVTGPVHRFDQFSDYGGGGFHPAGNEVIINSEVWDLRKFRLLRSVPSLDQTTITFNSRGDTIYAILRRNIEDVMSVVNTRRVKHPLFAAFRTVDAVNYSDIATIPVDRCVLDFATEPTDSFVGLVTMDDQEEMFSSARRKTEQPLFDNIRHPFAIGKCIREQDRNDQFIHHRLVNDQYQFISLDDLLSE
ncbi:hypothetical protein ACFE04_010872 [Oxalis oulophora]